MRTPIVCAGLILLAIPLTASGSPRVTAGPLDEHFLMTSIEGDRFEVQGGAMALEKAQCPAITRLAKRLESDHRKSLSESASLARRLRVPVPKAPTPSMQWELGQVSRMTGPAFEKAYATLEVKDHVEDIQNATEEASKGETLAVRASARKEVPVLRAHLALSKAAARTC